MSAAPWIGDPPPKPAARPKCPACDKPLRPNIVTNTERDRTVPGFALREVSREWTGHYRAYGAFCSLRCCEVFANAAYRAALRVPR